MTHSYRTQPQTLPHRRPTESEVEALTLLLTSSGGVVLLPVLFNGEQRYAIGIPHQSRGVYVLAVCPTGLDQIINLHGEQAKSETAGADPPKNLRKPIRRTGL